VRYIGFFTDLLGFRFERVKRSTAQVTLDALQSV
jgi:hypothetical protein